MNEEERKKSNRRLAKRLVLVAVAMFGFGYLLVPLYDIFCDITGVNAKIERAKEISVGSMVDKSRQVTVEFTGQTMGGLNWTLAPDQKRIQVHPGQVVETSFYARNEANDQITAQAAPSVTPFQASGHLKKVECFCFTQQTLAAGESKHMPIRFYLDPDLPPEVNTVTLSYAFYGLELNKAAAVQDQ